MTQQLIDKLDQVEELLKHQPGRHDQQAHAGTRGRGGTAGGGSFMQDRKDVVGKFNLYKSYRRNEAAGVMSSYDVQRHKDAWSGMQDLGFSKVRGEKSSDASTWKKGATDVTISNRSEGGTRWQITKGMTPAQQEYQRNIGRYER